jgi:hypothetical protein
MNCRGSISVDSHRRCCVTAVLVADLLNIDHLIATAEPGPGDIVPIATVTLVRAVGPASTVTAGVTLFILRAAVVDNWEAVL